MSPMNVGHVWAATVLGLVMNACVSAHHGPHGGEAVTDRPHQQEDEDSDTVPEHIGHLIELADRHREDELGERALMTAFVTARSDGHADLLYELGQTIADRYPDSDRIPDVFRAMGGYASVRCEFDRAIGYLDRAAAHGAKDRTALLLDAGKLRASLGDRQGAKESFHTAMLTAGGDPMRRSAAAELGDLMDRGFAASEVTRTPADEVRGLGEARDRLLLDPFDHEALRLLSGAYIEAGDPHAARLVLERMAEARDDAEDLNLLGVISYEIGDHTRALQAFRQAEAAGSAAAVLNLAAMARERGLVEFADELTRDVAGGRDGELIESARAFATPP